MQDLLTHLAIYLAAGGLAGFMAGLFGVGGGVVIVPALAFAFELMHFPPELHVKLAVATSMAIIVFTSAASARAHHRNHNVDWAAVKRFLPPVPLGAAAGALGGAYISAHALAALVCLFQLTMAVNYLRQATGKPSTAEPPAPALAPRRADMWELAVAGATGALSAVIGIAGGTLLVPLLHRHGLSLKRAIGTSSALGIFTGLFAALIYGAAPVASGEVLPPYSAGYLYLPAFAGCAAGSVCFTRYGAELGHRLSPRALKASFAGVLLLAAGKMAFKLMHG